MFDDPPRPELLYSVRAGARRRRVDAIVARFSRAFPDIEYELLWKDDLPNAMAANSAGGRTVFVGGGLARHRLIGAEALVLTLAHETGHLAAGPPREGQNHGLSCEGQADYWATAVALPACWPEACSAAFVDRALSQLMALQQRGFARPVAVPQRSRSGGRFGCLDPLPWGCRRKTLLAGLAKKPKPNCACQM